MNEVSHVSRVKKQSIVIPDALILREKNYKTLKQIIII